MREHTRLYMKFFGFGEQDFIPSELSGQKAVDIHHINSRGSGGTTQEEDIENLMAVTREEHNKYGDKKQYVEFLRERHFAYIKARRPDYEFRGVSET